jgi:hypothetical protein
MFIAKTVRLAQVRGQLFVVVAQFGEHIHGCDIIRFIVEDALEPADMSNQRGVVPPILRTRSAMSSVMAKICSACSSRSR